MADQSTSLPVRTEADPDERLQSKIIDFTTPGQGMEVDTDGNAHVEVHGNRADDAADVTLLLSEEGRPNPRGDYEADDNSKPASVGVIALTRDASPADTLQVQRVTAIPGESDSVNMDVAMHHSDGDEIDEANPLFVSFAENPGDEVVDYDTDSAIAKDATSNHDYTVTSAKTLLIDEIWASASGKMKIEVQFETAASSGVFNSKWVGFNSTANPNIRIPSEKIGKQVADAIVRIIRTNLDNQAQDLYSTIVGIEK